MTRYLVNWPALLLPLVALGTVGLLGVPVPQILVILAVLLALAAPAEAAKIAHFALFAYGPRAVQAAFPADLRIAGRAVRAGDRVSRGNRYSRRIPAHVADERA